MKKYRVLFASSEIYPLIKTGGLADVAGSLPHELQKAGHDVHIILPAYQTVVSKLTKPAKTCVDTSILQYAVGLKQTTLPGTRVPVWLVDCPELYDRAGNPYLDESGQPWSDNAMRFMVFCQMITLVAMNRCGLDWLPDVVHCNDWQTGLVPALLAQEASRPATVFTIHNLAYQGVFDRSTFEQLQLADNFWHYERLEYHGQFSFIKAGLVYSDRINTVSPNYAKEIQTEHFGHGMQDVLQHRADRLSGIINGIDEKVWNPGTDENIVQKYNRQKIKDKYINKQALQELYSLPADKSVLLLGLVSRLAEQKGIDMILSILPILVTRPIQLVILGSGEDEYEQALKHAADNWPDKVAVYIGYDEKRAHLIEAGIDAFLMPSRFEPCGLNQMYSQRYGTLPIVTPVGGLKDTVVDANEENQTTATATGFVMDKVSETALIDAIDRVLECYADQSLWRTLIKTAMQQDFSWTKSAAEYSQLYQLAIAEINQTV